MGIVSNLCYTLLIVCSRGYIYQYFPGDGRQLVHSFNSDKFSLRTSSVFWNSPMPFVNDAIFNDKKGRLWSSSSGMRGMGHESVCAVSPSFVLAHTYPNLPRCVAKF